MKNMRRKLLFAYYAPIGVGVLRIVTTIAVFIWNPQALPLRFIQIIPLLVLLVSLFSYMKLFTDNDPIVSLLLPTIAHFLVIFGFRRQVVLIPFIPLVVLDVVYLFVKGLKSTMYPFEIEGEEDYEDELLEDEV